MIMIKRYLQGLAGHTKDKEQIKHIQNNLKQIYHKVKLVLENRPTSCNITLSTYYRDTRIIINHLDVS